MHTLPLCFALLTYTGFWRPTASPLYTLKYYLYNVYSVIMILLLYSFAFWGIMAIFMSDDLNELVDKLSLFISVIGVCCKVANLFLRRGKIIKVVNSLLKENCIPKNQEEVIIQQKFDRFARNLTVYCEILNELAVFFATLAQFGKFSSTRTLPLANWAPYDLSSKFVYTLSFLHQTIGLMVCANASVAHETLISGLMIQTCAQFEILGHRARSLAILMRDAYKSSKSVKDAKIRERRIISDLVQYHLDVYEFASNVNRVFNFMMFVQFSISSTVLCLSIFRMSTTPFSVDFVWSFSYLLCMLMQIYMYCWFGNEVTLKSVQISDAIYEMDWTTLPVDVMKDLVLIMARSKKPVKMTSGHVAVLSAQSFMKILKLSYSSYNVLSDS